MAGQIIWLASYPKSGNTWLRLLLANLLSGKPESVDINEITLEHGSVVSRHAFEEATLLDSSLLTHDEVDALRPQVVEALAAEAEGDVFAKLHDAYRLLANGKPLLGQGQARAALYVLRDPRDVAISYAFHNGSTIEKSIAVLNDTHTLSLEQIPVTTAQANTTAAPVANKSWLSRAVQVTGATTGNIIPSFTKPTAGGTDTFLQPSTVGPSGGTVPHENRQPYLTLVYCICYDGVYPTRH